MRSSGRAANLRALLLDDCAILDQVSSLVEEVRRQSLIDPRGTRLGSLMLESSVIPTRDGAKVMKRGTREIILPDDVYRILVASLRTRSSQSTPVSKRALLVTRAAIRNATFAPTSERDRDSHILFRTEEGLHCAGRIAYMFMHDGLSALVPPALFLIIEPYQGLSAQEQWMDKQYRAFKRGGFCCKPTFLDKVVITASNVLCHVAKTAIKIEGVSQPLFHMLPLGKVSHRIILKVHSLTNEK